VADDQVLIGEPGNQTLPGIVYVYSRNGSGWNETGRLTVSPLTAAPDGFGRSLDAHGGTVIIGAPGWDGGRGAAMVYRTDEAGSWTEVARLAAADLSADAGFGAAVAIGQGVAVISAPGQDEGAGAVYVFALDGDRWVERGQARPDEATGGFGTAVALHGSTVLATTAPSRDAPSQVFAFRLDPMSGRPSPRGILEAGMDLGERSGFGSTIAVQGQLALVGAPGA